MDCPSRLELLEAVHGTGDSPGVREHLGACPACKASYDGMMGATELLSKTPLGTPGGRCLSDAEVAAYARRSVPREREAGLEEHLAACSACRGEVAALVEALEAEPGDVPAGLERRALGLARPPARRADLRRFRRPGVPAIVWAGAAAATLFFAVLLLLPGGPPVAPERPAARQPGPRIEPRAEPPVPIPEAPKPEPQKPGPGTPEPRIEPPKPPAPEPPTPEAPRAVVKVEPPKVEAPKVEPRTEAPRPPPPEPPKSEVAAAKIVPLKVTALAGTLSHRSASGEAPVARPFALGRGEELFTGLRHPARFTAEGGVTGYLQKGTAVAAEQAEGGELRMTLRSGVAAFSVEKRAQPFVVAARHAEAVVIGTVFQLTVDDRAATLLVVEGTVRFRNEKGEVLVKAGQRSVARAKERPSTPARVDALAETAWTRRPDLAGDPKAELWIEVATGGNRKYPGLVVAHPYFQGEVDSGRLARTLSESMDVGMILGHNHRDAARKVWMNVDRGMECEVRDDGTRGPARATPRMKKVTEDYLDHMKAAAGLPPRGALPMVVCLREHNYAAVAGGPLEVCEVAWTGFQRRTIEQLKALYAQLLDKHRPAYRVEMRFEGIDESYPYKGARQNFQFTEGDAEGDGYLAPRHAQSSVTFFFNPAFAGDKADIEVYSRILEEMVEFLWAQRKR